MRIEQLTWDSEFFGFKVGKLASDDRPESFQVVQKEMNERGFRLVYWATPHAHSALQDHHIVEQLTLVRPVNLETEVSPVWCHGHHEELSVVVHSHCAPGDQLVALAMEAGWSSRFRIDPHVDDQTFERLYLTWIQKSCLGEAADRVITVWDANTIAGFVTVAHRGDECKVGLIAVSPEYQRRGIGRQLLSQVRMFATDVGAITLSVTTQSNNAGAVRLYQSAGYTVREGLHWYHFWNDEGADG